MKVKSESEVSQSCPTPSNPMDCSPRGFSIHGIFQARVLEWSAIAFSEQRAITNSSRKNEVAGPTWEQHSAMDVCSVKSDAVENNTA